ncbi:MMPL family transporter [Mycobacterium tuberculosis]
MTAIGRLIHRYAIWIVGVWALAAIIGNTLPRHSSRSSPPRISRSRRLAPPLRVPWNGQRRPSPKRPATTSDLVLERNGVLNDQDRAYYDALVVALRRDSRHVIEVVDWWGTRPSREVARSDDHPR